MITQLKGQEHVFLLTYTLTSSHLTTVQCCSNEAASSPVPFLHSFDLRMSLRWSACLKSPLFDVLAKTLFCV